MALRRRRRRLRRKKRRSRRRLVFRLALVVIAAAAGSALFCAGNLLYLRGFNPWFTHVQAQRRIEAAFAREPYSPTREFVPLEQIPLHVQHAVIAAEDGAFYEHGGVDWDELRIVLDGALNDGKRLRGGSTISQQLAKNLFLTTHRSLLRKGLEFYLAPLTEALLSKERILELYLNEVEWGPAVWGIEAAARFHYRIGARELDRGQAARLAACLPAPRSRRPQAMDRYGAVILERMRSRGW